MRQKTSIFQKFTSLKLIDGALHLLYPNECLICETELARIENVICIDCYTDLHVTYYERFTEPNDLEILFWGRAQLEMAYALLYYEKTNSSKNLLKALKYKRRADVGRHFGKMLGTRILPLEKTSTIEVLIPVPIHPKKEFARGYNQSKMIAEGISSATNIPIDDGFIKRNVNSKSQTKLGRFTRWDNVEGKFSLSSKSHYNHIALVDDVVTTGATLETIILEIRAKHPDIKISILSLAITR